MNGGTHAFHQDERNRDIKVYVNREIVHRDQAKISVFDSGFLLGDGIWESFRLHNGKLAFLAQHMYRLRESAKALDMDLGMTDEEIVDAIYDTTRANDMETNVHIRLVFSRGIKALHSRTRELILVDVRWSSSQNTSWLMKAPKV